MSLISHNLFSLLSLSLVLSHFKMAHGKLLVKHFTTFGLKVWKALLNGILFDLLNHQIQWFGKKNQTIIGTCAIGMIQKTNKLSGLFCSKLEALFFAFEAKLILDSIC